MVPRIDDGSANLDESILMTKIVIADDTKPMLARPHQLGLNSRVTADTLTNQVFELERGLVKKMLYQISVLELIFALI